MSGSQRKRKANQDRVVDRICECILSDGAPFDSGMVVDLADLKNELSTAARTDTLYGQQLIRELVKAVREEWFHDIRATQLVKELIEAAASTQ
jgi:hypothetical protein